MRSPFEQFEIILLKRYSYHGYDISLTNFSFFLFLILMFLVLMSLSIRNSSKVFPTPWQNLIEVFTIFLYGMLIEQAGKKGRKYFSFIFSVFFFILLSNLVGLLPFSFTLTSHFIATLTISLSFFFAWILIGIKKFGIKFFYLFVPKNISRALLPLLVVIEILSFLLRPLSLAIRLFANMLAGHILLHIIAGSVLLVMSQAFFLFFMPLLVVITVFVLELGICFLQAYIFCILLSIYLKDSLYLH